jgi:hypothetical protein
MESYKKVYVIPCKPAALGSAPSTRQEEDTKFLNHDLIRVQPFCAPGLSCLLLQTSGDGTTSNARRNIVVVISSPVVSAEAEMIILLFLHG